MNQGDQVDNHERLRQHEGCTTGASIIPQWYLQASAAAVGTSIYLDTGDAFNPAHNLFILSLFINDASSIEEAAYRPCNSMLLF